jgi:hypothetical protein
LLTPNTSQNPSSPYLYSVFRFDSSSFDTSWIQDVLINSEGQLKPTLFALWKAAHAQGAQEVEALSFWQHLFAKHEFPEEHFICDAEIRPSPGDRRRIDRGVRFLSTRGEIMVLCLDACKKSLESHPWQKHIYALTTAKTMGKAWLYQKDEDQLTPLFDDNYIEAHSSEGQKLRKCFQRMKTILPADPAGAPNSNVASHSHSVRTMAVTPAATAPVSNPIFPRTVATSPGSQATTPVISRAPSSTTEGFTHVKAMRDPQDGGKTLVYQTADGSWKAMGMVEQSARDGRTILVSRERRVWVYVSDVR